MPRVIETTVYQFDELSTNAQEHGISELWDVNVNNTYWFEGVTEDISEFGEVSGLGCEYGRQFALDRRRYIHITDCQVMLSTLVENKSKMADFPNLYTAVIEPFFARLGDKRLRQLLRLERAGILGYLSGETSTDRRGIRFDIERYDRNNTPRCTALIEMLEEIWEDFLRDLEHEYVAMLDSEYDYQTDKEQVIESIRANKYEFTEDGHLA